MSNAPERKEGKTPVSSGVDRLHGLKLVTPDERVVKQGSFRIELHEDLASACSGSHRTPQSPAVEETDAEPGRARTTLAGNQISKIAAFAVAGLMIGYFFGKRR